MCHTDDMLAQINPALRVPPAIADDSVTSWSVFVFIVERRPIRAGPGRGQRWPRPVFNTAPYIHCC